MTATFRYYQDKRRQRRSHARFLTLASSLIIVAFVSVFSTSCTKHTFTQNITFDPQKTLADHGFSVQSGGQMPEKRNTDGSAEFAWRGVIVSSKPNDWEVLPGLWRDDIEKNLGFKPYEKFPSPEMRKPGEPFEGSLSWTDNGIRAEMQISLKQDESTKGVDYQISVKEQMVKK
jgi:hypothetical protein